MRGERLDIVHFCTGDIVGGAARCAYRVHTGVRSLGHRSRMLVSRKYSTDADVDVVHGGEIERVANIVADKVERRLGYEYQFVPSTRRMLRHPWAQHPSVFQLFNTHGGYFATSALARLSARAPLVWWLADMWPLTGHCIYSGACMRWQTGCGSCPDLSIHPSLGRDRTAKLFQRKKVIYAECDLTIVAPSTWMQRVAQESPLLGRFSIRHIPNGLDVNVFRPIDRRAARARFDLPPTVPVILFAAHVLDENPRKGAPMLVEALNRAELPPGTTLVLMGQGSGDWRSHVRIGTRVLGNLTDDETLAMAYSAADVFVAPSMSDNLPSTVLESMACGVPAVAFDAGGIGDAVRHDRTGYLARHMDVDDLARGLTMLLRDDDRRRAYGAASRATMEREFALHLQSVRFVDLYSELVDRRARQSPSPRATLPASLAST
ncbi:MAG TPA: glycosyltransferase family 4 protein [Gemmatimonadaceae bacterium]|nr:glycosyltransferase family 4 protein [Gemmatimonadaceae bacterium]